MCLGCFRSHEDHMEGLTEEHSSASKELTWVTENRINEMRSWLFQPFLYYVIHQGSLLSNFKGHASPGPSLYEIFEASLGSISSEDNVFHPVESNISGHPNESRNYLPHMQSIQLQALIKAGIDCNLKIIEGRSLRHRHHGLWYDLRALVTACLI